MSALTRYCQALDLVDDPKLIAEYEQIHRQIWPEVAKNIRDSGVVDMQIWRIGTRLFMIMDVNETFSFERASQMGESNPTVVKWEEQMWQFQVATPWAAEGGKWVLMEQIFSLAAQAQ